MDLGDGSENLAFPCVVCNSDDASRIVPSRAGRDSAARLLICSLLATHVVVDLVLLVGPWQFTDSNLVLVVAWPMSQNGLIAIWASTARGVSSYWRYGATIAGMSWTWFLFVVLPSGIAIYGRESAGWAAAFAVQSAVIVLVVAVCRLLARRIRSWRATDSRDTRRLQFSIAFLLLWTAVIAMTLGLGRSALTWFGWTSEVVHWEYFTLMPVMGDYNAAYTLLVLFSVASRTRLLRRIAGVAMVVGVLGYCQPYVLRLFSGGPVGLTTTDALVLAGSQAVYLYATLLPLRLVHQRQVRLDSIEEEASGSSPRPRRPVRHLA